jgi:aurora kinase, other
MRYFPFRHLSDLQASYHVRCVASAIRYLHDRNVIHRDIKPENVLYDGNGVPKLADFGWAVHAPKKHSRRMTLCGTPEYLAPEVVTGKGHEFGVDVWALGIMAYELIVGCSPFAAEVRPICAGSATLCDHWWDRGRRKRERLTESPMET